jgi:hypothetical protein
MYHVQESKHDIHTGIQNISVYIKQETIVWFFFNKQHCNMSHTLASAPLYIQVVRFNGTITQKLNPVVPVHRTNDYQIHTR